MTIGTPPRSSAVGARPRTLVGLLRWRAQTEPERTAYRFLADDETGPADITYGELDGRARDIAAHLQSLDAVGARALLLFPPGLDYVAAFFGCLYTGVVAVPAPPPRANRNSTLQSIAADSRATLALTTGAVMRRAQHAPARGGWPDALRWLATDRLAPAPAREWAEPEVDEEGLAYLQYTSGSTSSPRGVMVTHGNVLHNSADIHEGFGHTPESVSLSWLPHYHDMGLVDGIIQPLYGGFPGILMAPASFLRRPLGWLEAVSRYRVTHSGGPNFAYELCVRRGGQGQRAAIDLSSWGVAYNGAEPVRHDTLERFAEAFAPCGFRRSSFYPAYGLAEATLKVTGGQRGAGAALRTVSAGALEQHRVVAAEAGDDEARTLVGSGRPAPSTEVRIVDPETLAPCASDEVGEIWVSGPGVARGYWGNEEATEHTFHAYLPETGEGPYLRTGDLGFLSGGELFVTGRLKDLIIIRGRNHYPQDIESAAERSHASLRQGGGAAFPVETCGEERLVVVQEVEPRSREEWPAVIDRMREAITEAFEIQPAAVLLLKAGAVPKTSSGKVRRAAARAKFLSGDWEVIADWRAPSGEELADNDSTANADAPSEPSSAASIMNWLRGRLAATLGVAPGEVDAGVPLTRYGVDSLMAVELMHAVETRLGVLLPLADFLESPSLTQLAARAAEQLSGARAAQGNADAPTERERRAPGAAGEWHPLSHNQQSLWFLHEVAPENTAYNVAFAARVRGSLETEALRRAFQSLVARHASLRTSFAVVEGRPAQRVHERADILFRLEDARGWGETALNERLSLEARHHFDLAEAPLLRVFLFERGADERVLLLVAHHIILDFWSLSVLMRELGALYLAEARGEHAALDPPALEYTDYVRRQSDFLNGPEGERLREFWQRELAGDLPVLDLPTDYPRPAVQSQRGASTSLRLDARLAEKLKSIARANDATLYMTLLAAFQVLLCRHAGQREVLVGTPTSGRGSARLAGTVGYFVNPVVVRGRLSAEMSFAELLGQVRGAALAAFAHQEYPFDLLVKQLQPERDAARTPLFQVMFALHKAHGEGEEGLAAFALGEAGAQVRIGGAAWESVALEQRIAQFDLALTMAEAEGGLLASFEYCTDLFEASTIERMAGRFRVLLEAIADDPAQRLDRLPLLTDAERAQLLGEWNEAPRPAAGVGPFVHTMFEHRAAERPHQTAVVCEGRGVSYGELNARANRLARHLRARGVGPDVLVAICAERSAEMLVGVLAVLKAGGAYVPLDPSYPRERLSFMLADSGAGVVLTQQKLSGTLPASAAPVVHLDADWPAAGHETETNPGVEVHADNVAYCIYTSGSTGTPKGVLVGHGALANYIGAMAEEFAVTAEDRLLQFASLSFDVSAEEIFTCLTSGATLVLRTEEVAASPAATLAACREHRITVLDLPTAYWHQLAAGLTASELDAADCLRLVVVGGERLRAELLPRWRQAAGARVRLVDVYGPTEATIGTTVCDLTGDAARPGEGARVSIGRPVRNAQAYVLDGLLQPVPVGVAGELHVGGLGLARGYLGRPALTAEKFIPHPFSGAPGARLYKTGDLARFLPDGRIEFLGRLDSQVKVRGFRVELGEIERALAEHSHVREAVVFLREDEGAKRLVAYVVGNGAGAPAAADLRRHLKERLPEYMLPSAFVALDRLPLAPGGKVDHRRLPAPDGARPELPSAFAAPRTEAERTLARIWADVLKLEHVGREDNFFELGGDSILTIQVVARSRAAGLSLTARQMFTHPTVAELAAVAGRAPMVEAEPEVRPAGDVPLTPIQHWFFAQEFANVDHWNMAVLLEVGPALRAEELERALAELVGRHDALRLRFAREGARWRQFITEDVRGQFELRLADLSGTAEGEQTAAIEALAREAQAGLSLSDGPLLRAVLYNLGEGRAARLLLIAHHLVIDAVSWSILLDELAALCGRTPSGAPFELPPRTTSFKAWAERLERYAHSEQARAGADYWTALAAKEFKSLPVDFGGGADTEATTRTVSVSLSAEETRALLRDVPAVYHTQINDVLLTALWAAFARWTGEGALLLELEGHGREDLSAGADLSRTVGWFTSAFPVLLELDGPFDPGKALRAVKEQLRAVPASGIGYGLLRYLAAGADSGAPPPPAPPRPELSFNYLGQMDATLGGAAFRLAPESCGPTRDGRNRRTHVLEVNAGVYDRQLRLDWSYSSGLHEAATVEGLASAYVEALRAVIEHCLSPGAGGHTPSDFPLAKLSQAALDALLATAGPAADLYPLSPMQQGMLFHTLYSPEAGLYIEQLSCSLDGDLDESAFAEAWRRVAERHAVLRTSFVWENLDAPLQVVRPAAELKLDRHDWRGLPPEERERRLESFLAEDRRRAFDLSRAPLMRLALVRLSDASYRFVWTHHHILLDGWSVALLLREVVDAYEALSRGEEPQAAAARPFRDYVEWLQRQDASKAGPFWRAELQGFTTPTPLPAGRPDGGGDDGRPRRVLKQQARLTPGETAALQSFARAHRLTLSTLVHGALALLLSRYSSEEDVVFGTTVSGRPPELAGVDGVAGLFINTLPVRARVTPGAPAVEWLRELQGRLASLREYEHSLLAEVQRASDVARGRDLFECLLVFENYPVDAALMREGRPLKFGDVVSFEQTNYALTVAALPGAELALQALSTSDRFDADTLERLLRHLKCLLLDIAASPEKTLADAEMLSEGERRRILSEWNATARPYDRETSVTRLIERQAALRPGAAAVVCGGRRLSFGELNARANQVARHLRRHGVGPDVVVGVCLERSPEMVVALLGVLKAGAAYAPLDPAYPRERLAFMAEDAGGPVLLTERSLMDHFAGQPARLVCLDADWDTIAREADDNLPDAAAPENLAYCIYTSGSTGRPKGVGVTRGSLLNLIHWYGRAFDLTPADQSTHLSGIGFDVSVMDLWPNLAAGVCVHQPPDEETRLSPEKLRDWLVASRITVGFAPTPLAELMMELEWPEGAALRVLTTGGDKLHRYPGAALPFSVANIYGPTENTVGTTVEMLEPGGDEPAQSPPIGRPFDNVEVYLLDSRLRPVPVGVIGELYVGGASLARGYWRRPDLTAERFIPHPFSGEPGARLYRIGDLGRYLPDGRLEYLGRVDFQVKVRGYRIELGEIETVLAAHEAVAAAAVVLREDAPGEKQLVAYVTPADEEQLMPVGELRGHLRERLPEYMVPSAFVVLGALPLTPNGKVDRRALPAPGAPPAADGFVAPRNAVEEALADIWRDVLGVGRVGVFDDFFELGGHSLMATRVLSNVRRIFRLELPLRVVFEAHTIAELAPAVVAYETRPGQTEKIAQVIRKLKGISAEEVKKELERKRVERGRR